MMHNIRKALINSIIALVYISLRFLLFLFDVNEYCFIFFLIVQFFKSEILLSQIIARLFRTLDTYLISFRKGHKKQAFHCIEYFQVIISFHQINCLDVHCDNPLSLSFTKSSQDMFTESQYAAQIGNISGKSQCEDFRMDATFRSYPPTNEVGTCPWTFGKNVDNDRVPRELWEAKCACRCGLRRTDCLQYRCVPVYTYVTVLRRKNCTNVTQEIFPLSVGCTQVRLIRRLDANQMIP